MRSCTSLCCKTHLTSLTLSLIFGYSLLLTLKIWAYHLFLWIQLSTVTVSAVTNHKYLTLIFFRFHYFAFIFSGICYIIADCFKTPQTGCYLINSSMVCLQMTRDKVVGRRNLTFQIFSKIVYWYQSFQFRNFRKRSTTSGVNRLRIWLIIRWHMQSDFLFHFCAFQAYFYHCLNNTVF